MRSTYVTHKKVDTFSSLLMKATREKCNELDKHCVANALSSFGKTVTFRFGVETLLQRYLKLASVQ